VRAVGYQTRPVIQPKDRQAASIDVANANAPLLNMQ
jgi:hypothetical protein